MPLTRAPGTRAAGPLTSGYMPEPMGVPRTSTSRAPDAVPTTSSSPKDAAFSACAPSGTSPRESNCVCCSDSTSAKHRTRLPATQTPPSASAAVALNEAPTRLARASSRGAFTAATSTATTAVPVLTNSREPAAANDVTGPRSRRPILVPSACNSSTPWSLPTASQSRTPSNAVGARTSGVVACTLGSSPGSVNRTSEPAPLYRTATTTSFPVKTAPTGVPAMLRAATLAPD